MKRMTLKPFFSLSNMDQNVKNITNNKKKTRIYHQNSTRYEPSRRAPLKKSAIGIAFLPDC